MRQQLEIPSDALVIGSFGMALPHKGIDTLVEAIKPLTAATGRDVYFVSLNATINASSKVLVGDYKRLAERLGVNSKVRWVNDYLAIDKSQTLLTAADYIVYPYAKTRGERQRCSHHRYLGIAPRLGKSQPYFLGYTRRHQSHVGE